MVDPHVTADSHDQGGDAPDTLGVATPGYRILKRIGYGGMATVYLAVQERLERTVALKVLTRDLLADPDCETRFVNEGKIIAQLSHTSIVTIYDIGIFDGRYFLAMEYLPGGTLVERIRGGLTQAEAVRILREVAQALEHAHARGILHRDVKPGNILFRENGTSVLSDFGIAKAMMGGSSQLTRVGFTVGTPDYMSPEQARGLPLDPRSDLYSLGAVFYEMAAGRPPYRGEDAFATARLHVEGEVPRLPVGYQQYQPILDRLMAKDPAGRFATATQLIAAVESMKADQGTRIRARQPPISRTSETESDGGPNGRPTSRSRRIILGAAAMVLAAALLGGAWYWWNADRAELDRPVSSGTETIGTSVDVDTVRRRLQAQIDGIVRQIDCGVLDPELRSDGSVRLTGYTSEGGLAGVEGSLRVLEGVRRVDSAVATYALPLCRVMHALHPYITAAGQGRDGGVSLHLNSDQGMFKEGEYLEVTLEVTRPGDNYLQVDYVDGEGTIVHIFPSPGRAEQTRVEEGEVIVLGADGGGPRFQIAPPHGKNMILALLTRQPVFDAQRPQVESLDQYLPELRRRLEEQMTTFGEASVSARQQVFETRE